MNPLSDFFCTAGKESRPVLIFGLQWHFPGEKVGCFKTCLTSVLEGREGGRDRWSWFLFVIVRVRLQSSCQSYFLVMDMAGSARGELGSLPPIQGSLPLSITALAGHLQSLTSGTSTNFTADTTPPTASIPTGFTFTSNTQTTEQLQMSRY